MRRRSSERGLERRSLTGWQEAGRSSSTPHPLATSQAADAGAASALVTGWRGGGWLFPPVPAHRTPGMKLTRKQVLSRAKAPDLESVRKLNCWGSRLTDISIFHELPNIEVITLSVNSISTLEPISHCQNLTELYLRKNNIGSLSEVYYLKLLPKLRILWLSENPCCCPDPHRYRMTVLRNLPNLQKLDNQAVTAEEVSKAITEGEEFSAPPADSSNTENGHSEPAAEQNCPEATTESENDGLNFSMEETNKIREQLGMKPLPRDKFSPSPMEASGSRKKKNNILNAVLLLLKDLDTECLEIVQRTAESRIHQLQRKELQEER